MKGLSRDELQLDGFKYIDDGKEDIYIWLKDPNPNGKSLKINATEWLKMIGLNIEDLIK